MLRYNFQKADYAVETIVHGDLAETRLKETVPDLLVLDWMLPGRSGLEVLKTVRAKDSRTPVLLLTARDALEDRVEGLDSGADD